MTQSAPPLVELLSKPDCHLCEAAKGVLRDLQSEHAFVLHEINIAEQQGLLARYGEEIPVVFINGRKAAKFRINARQFVRQLRRAQGRGAPGLWQRFWSR